LNTWRYTPEDRSINKEGLRGGLSKCGNLENLEFTITIPLMATMEGRTNVGAIHNLEKLVSYIKKRRKRS
jgi:hypothetical protein